MEKAGYFVKQFDLGGDVHAVVPLQRPSDGGSLERTERIIDQSLGKLLYNQNRYEPG